MSPKISRRNAIKLAGMATASAFVSPQLNAQSSRKKKKVIVTGGGIAGLCCGYELMKKGHEVVVLEAQGRTGGHVYTIRDPFAPGLYGDAGAEQITKPGYDQFWKYVKEFNLTAIPIARRRNVISVKGGKVLTAETYRDPKYLKQRGFNQREIKYLSDKHYQFISNLYLGPYLDAFEDEYNPFGVGLDDYDHVKFRELLIRDGASPAAIRVIGRGSDSALYQLWMEFILKTRNIPTYCMELYRLKGGNETLPTTFARKLGNRVKLGCPVTKIQHSETGVKVFYREYGQETSTEGDYLVNTIPVTMLRRIPVSPDWPPEKKLVINSTSYYTLGHVMFQTRTRFWRKHKVSPNIDFGNKSLSNTWEVCDEVEGNRGMLLGQVSPKVPAEKSLEAFKKHYPGGESEIEQAYTWDWSTHLWAASCERLAFPIGTLNKFWPQLIKPHGRIHFAGAYADNLNWGMDAATRSANRAAEAIDQAD